MSVPLAPRHPAQLCLGGALIAADKAAEKGQPVLRAICSDIADAALATVDLVREIATDAEYLGGLIQDAASDGVISDAEVANIITKTREISEQARTGRIIA